MIFPTADEAAEVMELRKEALDFPATAVATKFTAVLGVLPMAIVLVGRDEPDTVFLPEALVERIAVVAAVADHSFTEIFFPVVAAKQGSLIQFV